MDSELRYLGTELDAETALALLEWQVEMGTDEAMLDQPQDRFDIVAKEEPASVSAPLPPLPDKAAAPVFQTQPDVPDHASLLAQAEMLAKSAKTLEDLAAAQQDFDGVELKRGARSFCFADGNPKAPVLVLGEAPGDEEDRQGRPFVGRAGQLLDRMFGAIGLTRDNVDAEHAFYVTNVLCWRPPANRDPSAAEIALSMPFVRRHVELVDPQVVVLMGNVPCQAALGRQGILRMRGNWTEAFGRPALPMTHPAYLLRTPVAKREAWADLLSLAAHLDRPKR